MSRLPLYKEGPLVERSIWPPAEVDTAANALEVVGDPPRALKSLARIIDEDLCHRCGSCVGICPTKVLALDKEEYPVVENLSACTDCDLCVKVCPGDEFDVIAAAKDKFGLVPPLEDMHGHFENAYLSYANDSELRADSTSGGAITAVLLSLLERGEIDGAVVVASDEIDRWKGKPIIARTAEQLLSSTKSKYAIAPTNAVFEEIRKQDGRYAVVGLPCQIHGVQKAALLDRRIKERVVLTIGLFCHAAIEHEPMREIWEGIQKRARGRSVTRFISRVGKHPGTPYVEFDDGSMEPVYFPDAKGFRPSSMEIINILYRLYTPQRCLTCYDSTSEFADIAVGDPWMAPPADDVDFREGYSFVLARTKAGDDALRGAESSEVLKLRRLEPEIARTSNTMMGIEKRWRAFRVMETMRRQGHAVPEYGFETPHASGKHKILTEFNVLSHILCFFKIGRLQVLRFAFSPMGYRLLWLNHKRRTFRDSRRAWVAKLKRRISGKQSIEPES
jgi:coenzyme F420 hydrogenase subunit beta